MVSVSSAFSLPTAVVPLLESETSTIQGMREAIVAGLGTEAKTDVCNFAIAHRSESISQPIKLVEIPIS